MLRTELAAGERPAIEVENAIHSAGISAATLRRARKRLGITLEGGCLRRGDGIADQGRWYWRLP
jgi:hypothetical protein